MLEAKEVVKSFDGFRALDSATLTVPKGTVYGLVGPNGAGKSTIIRHFTGVYRPDSGQLLLEGAPIWENTDAAIIAKDSVEFSSATISLMHASKCLCNRVSSILFKTVLLRFKWIVTFPIPFSMGTLKSTFHPKCS